MIRLEDIERRFAEYRRLLKEAPVEAAEWIHVATGALLLLIDDAGQERDQERVARWVRGTLGEATLQNKRERCFRFIEEALELVQALDFEKEDVLKMVEYVYSRDRGKPNQELGGAMVTALALAECVKLDAYDELHRELDRIFAKQDEVRAKHQQKIDGGFTG